MAEPGTYCVAFDGAKQVSGRCPAKEGDVVLITVFENCDNAELRCVVDGELIWTKSMGPMFANDSIRLTCGIGFARI